MILEGQRLVNVTRGTTVARLVECAVTRAERARGLLGRDGMERDTAMLFRGCRHLHTFGMRFPLDICFLDGRGRVVVFRRCLPPGRLSPLSFRARTAVELPAGTLLRTGTERGDRLALGTGPDPARFK